LGDLFSAASVTAGRTAIFAYIELALFDNQWLYLLLLFRRACPLTNVASCVLEPLWL
jgi:hypothetical protein